MSILSQTLSATYKLPIGRGGRLCYALSKKMKKFVVAFSIAWVVFSLITTGYEVLQPKWREQLKLNPYVVQAEAGNIYNHGAVAISQQANRPREAVLFVDQESGLLQGLPLVYWLSPTYLVPLYNQPLTKDLAALDSKKSLHQTLVSAEAHTIYYVGSQQTLDENKDLLQGYTETLVSSENDLVFMILEKKS